MDTDSIDYGVMEYDEDSLEETQQTQSTQQASQVSEECIDEHLWGYLQPCSGALTRIDFWRIHPRYSIGRNTETNQVVLPGFKVSNTHCTIVWDGIDTSHGSVLVTDLSSNGTYINNEKVGKNKSRILADGNEIAFGTSIPQPMNNGLEDYRFVYRHVAGGAIPKGFYAAYDLGAELGKGSFATVRKAVRHSDGAWFAVKMIAAAKTVRQPGGTGRSRNQILQREITIMEQLKHKNICQLVESFVQEDGAVNLVLEYVEGGDLLEHILQTDTGLDELSAKDITYQICRAMSYIHSKGVTHRDLKPENVLLTRDNPPIVKVADFGLAKVVDSLTMLRTMCGTPSYLAPEVVTGTGEGYDNLVDSWSVGVIVFSMLTNQSPFLEDEKDESVKTRILSRVVEWSVLNQTNPPLSYAAKSFIRQLLEKHPRRRMSLTSALQHEWLRDYQPFHANEDEDFMPANDAPMYEEHGEHLEEEYVSARNPALNMDGVFGTAGSSRTRLHRRQHVEESDIPAVQLPEEMIAYAQRNAAEETSQELLDFLTQQSTITKGAKKRMRHEFTPLPEEIPDADMSPRPGTRSSGRRRSTTSSPSDGQSSEGRAGPRRSTRHAAGSKAARRDY